MKLTDAQVNTFLETVWDYYSQHARDDLPWRQSEPDGSLDPYTVVVSELMLQQTQVARVIPKFHEFTQQFPSFQELDAASLAEVLQAWSGLGYNRRAKFLYEAAKQVVHEFAGHMPRSVKEMVKLPGIGKNTAGAIAAYAFNQPVVFIETNVRTVYIYHFFPERTDVTDKEIAEVVGQTLDQSNPREFYWALMDYGSSLKRSVRNLEQSKHYVRQSAFEGSRRQLRGAVLRALGTGSQPLDELNRVLSDSRLEDVLASLQQEGLVALRNDQYYLGG